MNKSLKRPHPLFYAAITLLFAAIGLAWIEHNAVAALLAWVPGVICAEEAIRAGRKRRQP